MSINLVGLLVCLKASNELSYAVTRLPSSLQSCPVVFIVVVVAHPLSISTVTRIVSCRIKNIPLQGNFEPLYIASLEFGRPVALSPEVRTKR